MLIFWMVHINCMPEYDLAELNVEMDRDLAARLSRNFDHFVVVLFFFLVLYLEI